MNRLEKICYGIMMGGLGLICILTFGVVCFATYKVFMFSIVAGICAVGVSLSFLAIVVLIFVEEEKLSKK